MENGWKRTRRLPRPVPKRRRQLQSREKRSSSGLFRKLSETVKRSQQRLGRKIDTIETVAETILLVILAPQMLVREGTGLDEGTRIATVDRVTLPVWNLES
jgi:hypothetical protein